MLRFVLWPAVSCCRQCPDARKPARGGLGCRENFLDIAGAYAGGHIAWIILILAFCIAGAYAGGHKAIPTRGGFAQFAGACVAGYLAKYHFDPLPHLAGAYAGGTAI